MVFSVWGKLGNRQKIKTLAELLRGFRHYSQFAYKRYVLAGPGVRIERRHGEIRLGNLVGFGREAGISVIGSDAQHFARLQIGSHTFIGDRTHINCQQQITIGEHCAISWDVEILDTDIHAVIDETGLPLTRCAAVLIEDRVWIGARCLILKGVTIGHDSVVAAGAVVTETIPPFRVCAGNPARVIKTISGWAA